MPASQQNMQDEFEESKDEPIDVSGELVVVSEHFCVVQEAANREKVEQMISMSQARSGTVSVKHFQ